MGVEEHHAGEVALRRICEGVAITVLGGIILWLVTGVSPRSAFRTEGSASVTAPAGPPATPAVSAPPVTSMRAPTSQPARATERLPVETGISARPLAKSQPASAAAVPAAPAANAGGVFPVPASAARQLVPFAAPNGQALPRRVPVETVFLLENFSHYRDGETPGWGPSTFIKTGTDRRHWLVSNVDGPHPVGCRIRLPDKFSFQCRYSAYVPEVTAGAAGWWKEPVASKITFVNASGGKHTIQWVVKYGAASTLLNPLGTPLIEAKRYYHSITLPDGAAGEVATPQPAGVLQIIRENNALTVHIDGQLAATGTMQASDPLVEFEIDVVKAKNGSLSFTDFKIAR